MKMKCCECNREAIIEILNQFTDGKKETKNYCKKHGTLEFQKLFREMYGLPRSE